MVTPGSLDPGMQSGLEVKWLMVNHADFNILVFYIKSSNTCNYFVYFKSKKQLNYDRFIDLIYLDLQIYCILFFILSWKKKKKFNTFELLQCTRFMCFADSACCVTNVSSLRYAKSTRRLINPLPQQSRIYFCF